MSKPDYLTITAIRSQSMGRTMTQPITLIYYRDEDGTPLLEAAEWRMTINNGAWCLAGCTDDIPLVISEIISTTSIEADANIRWRVPNSDARNSDPEYLRELIKRAGISQRGAAKRIGVSERSMRQYLSLTNRHEAPYHVQFALECLEGPSDEACD